MKVKDFDITPGKVQGLWFGSLEWESTGELWQSWRLPRLEIGKAHAPGLATWAQVPNGVHANICTDGARLTLALRARCDDIGPLDVLYDDRLIARHDLVVGDNQVEVSLPKREGSVEIWLPHYGQACIGEVVVREAVVCRAVGRMRPSWITYGSSITVCRSAPGPTETWPALVARRNAWELTCLGFGGECHLDPIAAEAAAGRDASLLSLCLGINVYGQASFGRRTWAGQVSGFISAARRTHRDVPAVVISPILFPEGEDKPNAVGMTLSDVREGVHRAVRSLQESGDEQLHLIDGRSLLGASDQRLLTDGLHPSADGNRLIADRLQPLLAEIYDGAFGTDDRVSGGAK